MKIFSRKPKNLINYRLGLNLAISLALGIGTAYCVFLSQTFIAVCTATAFLVYSTFTLIFGVGFTSKKNFLVVLALIVLFFSFGVLTFNLSVSKYKNANLNNHYTTIVGSVNEVTITENGATVVLNKVDCSLNNSRLSYKVRVYITGETSIKLGDRITFSEYLYDRNEIYDGRLSVYDISGGVKWTCYVNAESVQIIKSSPNLFQRVNLFIRNTLQKGLGEKERFVALALLTGDSTLVEEEVITDFRQSGVAHVFAVSGLHIGFLATGIGFLLSKLKLNKKLRTIILIACLFTYSGVCGFSASSLRASIMCSIASILKIFGKRYDGLNAVGLAGLIILLFTPMQMFCAGFVLSFGVVIGILIMQNPLERLFSFMPKKLGPALALVISAQLAGIPISIAFFGNFSIIAIICNLIFVPLVGFVFYLLLAGVLIGGILSISSVALFIPGLALKLLVWIITVFDYKIFIIGEIYLGGFALFYYLALFVACEMVKIKKALRLALSLILVTVCVFGSQIYTKAHKNEQVVYVSSTNSFSATFIDGNENALIVSYATYNFSNYSISRLINKLKIEQIDNLIITDATQRLDLQNLLTAINYNVPFENVYYYGQTDEVMENIIEKSFPNSNPTSYLDGELVCGSYTF